MASTEIQDELHMLPAAAHETPLLPAHVEGARDAAPGVPPHKGKANRWVLGIVGLALVGGGAFYLSHGKKAGNAGGPGGAASAGGDRTVPVVAATVVQKDMPIFLEGLGSVTSIATVQVKTQVDGRLDTVNFKEGQMVKKGSLLAQVDARPFTIQLHTAEAAVARDAAQLRNAKLNLDRYQTLRKQNLVAQQQVDDQQTVVDQNAATVQSDQAMIESARLNLDYARITSPLDGVTGVRNVDPGNIVHAADTTTTSQIVTITQMDPIAVLFTLPEDDLPKVAKELAGGAINVEADSRDGNIKLGMGQLLLIDNEINQQTASMRLKATFPNADKKLWPNQFVKARLLLTTRKNALVVPAAVVQRGPTGTFAYVVGADKTVSVRPVTVDVTQADIAIISKGLSAGEQVVVDGQNQLRPGSKVQARMADATSADGTNGPGSNSGSGDSTSGSGGSSGGGSGAPGSQSGGSGSSSTAPKSP